MPGRVVTKKKCPKGTNIVCKCKKKPAGRTGTKKKVVSVRPLITAKKGTKRVTIDQALLRKLDGIKRDKRNFLKALDALPKRWDLKTTVGINNYMQKRFFPKYTEVTNLSELMEKKYPKIFNTGGRGELDSLRSSARTSKATYDKKIISVKKHFARQFDKKLRSEEIKIIMRGARVKLT